MVGDWSAGCPDLHRRAEPALNHDEPGQFRTAPACEKWSHPTRLNRSSAAGSDYFRRGETNAARRAGEKCQCPCEEWFLDVRYPYLVVTTVLFIHKLWFDTHRSPQEDPQPAHRSSPDLSPGAGAKANIRKEPDTCIARTVAIPTPRCLTRGPPTMGRASAAAGSAHL